MVERNTAKLLESARMWHSGQRGRPNNGSSNSWWKKKKKDHFFPRAPNNNSIYNANFAFPNHIYNNLSKFQLVLSKLIFMLVHSFQNSFFFSIYFSLLFNTVTIKKIMFYHTFFFLISHSTTSMEVKFLKHSPLIIIMDMSIIMFSSKKKSV